MTLMVVFRIQIPVVQLNTILVVIDSHLHTL